MDDLAPRRGLGGAAANRSYMFFRITGLSNENEPVGAQGVPLTPGRSVAVDPQHDYGKACFPLPTPHDCAGYGIGDRRTGACRSLLGFRG
jgi:hypothetical protein